MPIEVNSSNVICSKCGTAYGRRKGYFLVSYAVLYKGIGHTAICKDCIDSIYNNYLAECENPADAVRQTCRKLDLYWNDRIFGMVESKSTPRTMMTQYLGKLNSVKYAGKCYDDTLLEEGALWAFSKNTETISPIKESVPNDIAESENDLSQIPDKVIAFWGPGYTADMYLDLEQRLDYWMSKFPEGTTLDIGTEALIKQICSLELDINKERVAGRPVDKSINALNTLLGSANLKPTQKKDDADMAAENTPFGVWIKKWEDGRPIPEPDPDLKDVDGIVKYIEIWFKGHLAKMLNIKNSYSKLYEEEMAKIRVAHPEYEDEDDETLFNDIFGNSTGGDIDESP